LKSGQATSKVRALWAAPARDTEMSDARSRQRELRCPICRGPVARQGNPHRPFCSERCRLVDLGNWASERYRIPGEAVSEAEVEETPGGDGDGG
jgi:endogenous inhibitor of DNA gyrase (YacG/DUF329 family)